MIRSIRYLFLAVMLCLSIEGVFAQVATGMQKFGTLGGGPVDTINLGSLNVHFSIPVLHKPGRGLPFNYDLTFDSSIWTRVKATSGGLISGRMWLPLANKGWGGSPLYVGSLDYTSVQPTNGAWKACGFVYTDGSNAAHRFQGCAYFDLSGNYPLTAVSLDGSGYTLTANAFGGGTLISADGNTIIPQNRGSFFGQSSGNTIDRNGNIVNVNSSGVFTDTLGQTVLQATGGEENPFTLTYTSPAGSPAVVTETPKAYTIQTNFQCSDVTDYGPYPGDLVDHITLADGSSYSFEYERTPGITQPSPDQPPIVTGRIVSVTLSTGGTITYSYTGSNNGINCADGSTLGMIRTTPDGTWSYSRALGSGNASTTTVTDPANNQTVIQFQSVRVLDPTLGTEVTYGSFETQRKTYQGSSTSGTLLQTIDTCYNGSSIPCTPTAISLPITQRTVVTQAGAVGALKKKHYEKYDEQTDQANNRYSYGLPVEISEYDFGSAVGPLLQKTTYSYPSNPGNVRSFFVEQKVQDGQGHILSKVTNYYDENVNLESSGIGSPTHTDVGSSRRGNLTRTALETGSTTLTKRYTYYDTGVRYQDFDVNSPSTPTNTYVYGSNSCLGAFPTTVNEPMGLSRSMTWNCIGGVQTSSTDENRNTRYTNYTTDTYFWRPESTRDELGNITYFTYPNPNQVESVFAFNNGASATDVLTTLDSLGRKILTQTREAPGSATFDTVETDYDVTGCGVSRTTLPFAGSAGMTNSGAPGVTTSFDALCRPLTVADSGGGATSFAYVGNNVLQSLIPAPSGENAKQKQLQYDGLGRLTSVCEITSGAGNGTCQQSTTKTGYWTKYTYGATGNYASTLTVSQNAQGTAQTRSYTFDGISRLVSESNPESGTTSYKYDSDASCPVPVLDPYSGDLVKNTDAVGNVTCYTYNKAHQLLSATTISGPYAYPNGSQVKQFVYNSATLNGTVMQNAAGRLARAYTYPTAGQGNTTDEYYSYSARGELTDVYQSTSHSGGFYHATASYWANGALNTLGLLNASGSKLVPNLTYSPDGAGRLNRVNADSGQNPISLVTYDPASRPTKVNIGSGDSDAFSYDPNTGRMTQYAYTVGSSCQPVVGTLNWNANGSMMSRGNYDPMTPANTDYCSYSHDDLGRLKTYNCAVTGWAQNFSYDAFGNISKDGTVIYTPGYNTPKNQAYSAAYDSNGNVTSIAGRTFAWDASGNSITIDGVSATFDAGDRMAEQNRSGGYTQVLYVPTGQKLALASNQALQKAFVPLPGGATAVYDNTGLSFYRHRDWLGSSRLTSSTARSVLSAPAYAPFGELQNTASDVSFTNQNQDTSPQLYDFLYREYNPYQGGRWASPDPAGLGAVDMTDPQTLNRYAYVGNRPLTFVDPLGLDGWDWGWGWGGSDGPWSETIPIPTATFDPSWIIWNFAQPMSPSDDGDVYSSDWIFYADAWLWLPATNGNRQPSQTSERLTRLKNCALAYYGIDPLSVSGLASNGAKWGSIATAAGGIPKSFAKSLGLRVIRQPGSSEYTSALSMLSLASGGGGALRTIANFGSKWAGPIAIASAVIDATAIGICTAMD
jgi:RHS repeat-associated protein